MALSGRNTTRAFREAARKRAADRKRIQAMNNAGSWEKLYGPSTGENSTGQSAGTSGRSTPPRVGRDNDDERMDEV